MEDGGRGGGNMKVEKRGKGRRPERRGLASRLTGPSGQAVLELVALGNTKERLREQGRIWCILLLRGYAQVYLIGLDNLISPIPLQLHRMTYLFGHTILQERQTWLSPIQSFSSTSPLPVSFIAKKGQTND